MREKEGGFAERLHRSLELDPRMLVMASALVVIWLVFHVLSDGRYLTARNLYNLAVQSSVVGIMATGMVLIIVARHIDLSVGSLMGFTGMMIAYLQVELFPVGAAWNWPLSIACGLVLGAVMGLYQGAWTAYGRVPAFVVTLGGLLTFRGAAFLITDGRTVAPLDPTYQLLGGGLRGSIGETWSWVLGAVGIAAVAAMRVSARVRRRRFESQVRPVWAELFAILLWAVLIAGFVLVVNSHYRPRTTIGRGIPVPVLILIITVVVMTFISQRTRFGRYVYAMGGNPEAAVLAGINVKKYTVLIFVVMGMLCAVAAVVATARQNAGVNSMGMWAELSVIAAAVIGGTSLSGGVGTVTGTILGAAIMQSLDNGMVLLGVSSPMRQVLIGQVLLLSVWFERVLRRR